MKGLRYLLPLLLACGFLTSNAFAANPLDEMDMAAIQDFLKSKRSLTVEEKGGCLMISGDVRAEYQYLCESANGEDYRGSGATHLSDGAFHYNPSLPAGQNGRVLLPVPTNEFDIEANLMLDYKGCDTWAHIHVEFDNHAGTDKFSCCGSGICDDICLYKAYLGYNIFECGCSRLDVEVGRRRLLHVFDSVVQFGSRFDGALLRYSNCFECVADFYVKAAAFVIDEKVNHFGFVGEIGFLDIMESGLDFKYSYIDWKKDGPTCYVRYQPAGQLEAPEFQFRVSQWTLAYNFCPEILRTSAKVYGAFLWNHDAQLHPSLPFVGLQQDKENCAWYVGARFGDIRCEGDWSVDIRYENVEAQAVPDCDVSGIGRGNVRGENLYQHGAGCTNYRGWLFEAVYALTDNLTLTTEVNYSTEVEKLIGGTHDYVKYEMELVYGF